MIDAIAGILVLLGALLIFISSLGLVRLPDVYSRMHATTKAGTLGSGFILLAVALQSLEWAVFLKSALAILFIVFTAPISAHLIGRSCHYLGLPVGTDIDHLKGRYQEIGDTLASTPRKRATAPSKADHAASSDTPSPARSS